jgi:hypothetical protein
MFLPSGTISKALLDTVLIMVTVMVVTMAMTMMMKVMLMVVIVKVMTVITGNNSKGYDGDNGGGDDDIMR